MTLSREYSYGAVPDVTEAVISPSLAPKQEISCPLKLEVMLPFTESTFGSVTVKAEGDEGDVAQPFTSVTENEYVPAQRLSNKVSVAEIVVPSTI